MDKEHTIINVEEFKSPVPGTKKYRFDVEGGPEGVTVLSKYDLEEGQSLYGHIAPNGQYLNFKFGKRDTKTTSSGSADVNAIKTTLGNIKYKLDLILKKLEIDEEDETRGYPYPKENSEGMADFKETKKADSPF